MIYKNSYLIFPPTRFFSEPVCFPPASQNCTIASTLGKMACLIMLVSISETVFSFHGGETSFLSDSPFADTYRGSPETMNHPLAAGTLPHILSGDISRQTGGLSSLHRSYTACAAVSVCRCVLSSVNCLH